MAEKELLAKDLRALPAADLASQLQKLREELWHYRLKAKDGSLQQTHLVRGVRRRIARVQTVMRQRP